MIKLKYLIKEEVLDKQIKNSINEMGELSKQINSLKDQLKPLQKKFGNLVDIVLPVVDEMGKENLKTKRYVFKIIRKGYEKRSFSYKEGFLSKNYSFIPIENLSDSTLTQTFIDKIFRLYDVKISCQGSKQEIHFKNMLNGQKLESNFSWSEYLTSITGSNNRNV